MASLNNLYISQSYQGLVHFGSNNTASAVLGVIEDGLGNSLGLFLNNSGDLRTTTSISSSTIEATNLKIKNKIEITGSIDIDGPVTASSALIEGNLNVLGSLTASAIYTLIESASIIYSSGSNILGDSTADIQTLNGTVIVSGSEEITGSLSVTNNISSSTISGIGNVSAYSQSVDSRLDIVEATASLYVPFSTSVDSRLVAVESTASYLNGAFSTSVDSRLDALEAFTGSQGLVTTSSFNAYTASTNIRLNNLETTSASVNTSISALNTFTASQSTASIVTSINNLNTFTSSANSRLNSLEAATASYANSASFASTITNLSSSIQVTDNAQTVRIDGLASFTGSYATTGSNSFNGNQTITGSLILSSSAAVELTAIGNSIFSGSVNGQVIPLTITSNTASMDCSLGNFFTITLNTSGSVRIEPSNIKSGQTLTLRLKQPAGGFSSVNFPSNVDYPTGFEYNATPAANSTDIITFLSFDTASLYYSRANQFI